MLLHTDYYLYFIEDIAVHVSLRMCITTSSLAFIGRVLHKYTVPELTWVPYALFTPDSFTHHNGLILASVNTILAMAIAQQCMHCEPHDVGPFP